MATAPQSAMEMPQEAAPNPFSDPNTMAVYDQMRQEVSPQEFSNEMLAGAAQIDPQAVAAFTKELQGLDIPPETLDALNDVVDEILASPDKYAELRKKYMDQGLPEEILPEQFDPQFFAALNMAIDQMIAAPTGVQAFAKGGIAELKPIAKVIASYGRNGDTMLAHITPAEARMLRRRGGSGTINPKTGLPEFFLKKLFQAAFAPLKLVAKAVQSFAKSTVGRIVLPIALGFFLGPAAAGLFGVGATSVAGLAISGFVGSAGSTLLAGGSLKDALKSGAISGLTAGAVAGIGNLTGLSSIPLTSAPSTASFGQSISNQFDALKGMLPGGTPAPNAFSTPAPGPGLDAAGAAPVPPTDSLDNFLKSNNAFDTAASNTVPTSGTELTNFRAAGSAPANVSQGDPFGNYMKQNPVGAAGTNAAPAPAVAARSLSSAPAYTPGGPGIGESFSKMGEGLGMGDKAASFDTFKQGATDLFSPGPTNAQVTARAYEIMGSNGGTLKDAMAAASKELSPTLLRTYGPAAVAGLGALSAFGGFKTQPVQPGPINQSLMTPVTQRIRQDGTQRQMYLQNMPGVVYDQYGEPTDGYSRLPTYDVPDYNAGGYGMYSASGQGIMNVPTVYNTPSGSIGSSRVEQPYNTASMYSNIMPRRFNDGGIADFAAVQPYIPGPVAPPPKTFDWKRYLEANTDLERVGIDTEEKAKAHWTGSGIKEGRPMNPEEYAIQRSTQAATDASNLAARTEVARKKDMRKTQGSANMYANINAGIAALAPETFPGAPVTLSPERRAAMDAALKGTVTDIQKSRVMRDNSFRPEEMAAYANLGFGDVNRRYNTALRQDAYAPMLEGQRNAMNQQRDIAANVPAASGNTGAVSQSPTDEIIHFGIDQYGRDARNGFGTAPPPGMQPIYGAPAVPPVAPPVTLPPGTLPLGTLPPVAPPVAPPVVKPVVKPVVPPATDAQKSQFTGLINSGNYQGGVDYARNLGYTNADIADYVGATGVKDVAGNVISQQTANNFLSGYAAPRPVPTNEQLGNFSSMLSGGNYQGGVDYARKLGYTDAEIAARVGGSRMTDQDGNIITGQTASNFLAGYPRALNMGGIAGLATGGYPRRNGQISGPGTEKSDEIPAMLSDGEFVMTAKAVRGAGKGSRRAGAKQMYKLMHQLEKNSQRG